MGFNGLVGGWEHDFYFPIQLGISSSQWTNSYFSEGFSQPPTRWDFFPAAKIGAEAGRKLDLNLSDWQQWSFHQQTCILAWNNGVFTIQGWVG